jgi:DNA-binding response OmpR family regulator
VTAENGEEGIEKAGTENPNLIILDIMMPGIDGLETLRRLKRAQETKYIPVVMLTAKGETKSIFKAQERGAVDYLIKPLESDQLLSVVQRHS